jgi:chemotaxis protein methyltransferase CheR
MSEAGPSARPFLSAEALNGFCELIYASTGMLFGQAKRYYIERRLAERMIQTASLSLEAYQDRLRRDPGEIEALINSFTVNETYFFREAHQLECLSRSLLPEIVKTRRPGDKVRIWSAPCATGEEAYSIAIWLLDHWRLVDAYHVEIVGSDIDTRVLAAAAQARYRARALDRLPRTALEAYFEPQADGERQLIQDLRESVSFTHVNLVDAASMAEQGRFDVIFCRNVLIYFDDASRRRAAELLHGRLNPGGYLCLGHAESMAGVSALYRMRRFPSAVVYQRAEP